MVKMYLRVSSEMYRVVLSSVIPVNLADESEYSIVRSVPFKKAISIDGKCPSAAQYIFASVTHAYNNETAM